MKLKFNNLLNIIIGILVIVLLIVIIYNNTNLKKNVNNLINKNNNSNSSSSSNNIENHILELKQSLNNLSNQYNKDMKLLKERTCYIKNFSDWRYAGGDRDIISIYQNRVCDF